MVVLACAEGYSVYLVIGAAGRFQLSLQDRTELSRRPGLDALAEPFLPGRPPILPCLSLLWSAL